MHRDALLRILNESCVPEGIAIKDLEQIAGQKLRINTITFNVDELTPEGTGISSRYTLPSNAKG